MSAKKINYWYKNFLSEFSKENISQFDTEDPSEKENMYIKEKVLDIDKSIKNNKGKPKKQYKKYYKTRVKKEIQNKKIRVPILKPENFGERMCIDDKNLGDYGFTIISNLNTGKIAAMIETRKSKIITEVLSQHVPQSTLNKVKVLTKDLAYNYEQVKKDNFWYATGVADKFHIIKLGLQAISDLRVKYRQEELTKERERRELHICNEARKKDSIEQRGGTYKITRCPPAKRMSNGETILQILASSNRALNQFQYKWVEGMQKRIQILFKLFPNLQKIYKLISVFRDIYDVSTFGEHTYLKAKTAFNKWLKKVGASDISELQNFASTVKHHKNNILAYFKTGDTNAYAESLNAQLQRFLRNNFGIKNLDFFLWRIKKIFA